MAQYGQLEKDIIENMMTEDERSTISDGMKNLNKIGNLVDKILAKLNEPKPPPNITSNVYVSNAQNSHDLADDIAKQIKQQIKRELQGYYTK
jgi:hypothetical protein